MFPKRHLMRAYEGRMEPLDFEKFCAELMSKGTFEICPVGDLVLDRVAAAMLDRAVFVAGLRGGGDSVPSVSQASVLLDAVQQPLLGYRKTNDSNVQIISGIFTFQQLMRLSTSEKLALRIPIFILHKPPKPEIRELILLNELSRNLLKQQFIDSPTQIADFLYSWFDCRSGSLFDNPKWRILFPTLKTKTDLCRWLQISSKTFIPSSRKTGGDDV